LAFDITTVLLSFVIAALVRYNFEYREIDFYLLQYQTLLAVGMYTIGFLVTQSYAGIIRHTSLTDAQRILEASFIAFLGLFILSTLGQFQGAPKEFQVSRSLIIVHFLTTMFMLLASRFLVKGMYASMINARDIRALNVLIYGTGAGALLTKNALFRDQTRNYVIHGFVGKNSNGKILEGIPVIGLSRLMESDYLVSNNIQQIILADNEIDYDDKDQIVNSFIERGIEVKTVPSLDRWIHGDLDIQQIKKVEIEELLGRDPIRLNSRHVMDQLHGKRVLVTGAAGSIGSEISKQLLHYTPYSVVMLDQAETPMFDLKMSLGEEIPEKRSQMEFVIADVRDTKRMEDIFTWYKPDIVYHAAAYKHVPLMEENPVEAVKVNFMGTKTLADLAQRHEVEKFVMISTDKAVNPTSVMGATKRVAELYCQYLEKKEENRTHFVTTRFGNVLGSNGSVIPLFTKQIQQGGPITVTHKEITRYFMTIPEACSLVLEAGSMGKGGEIFVFDMGKAVKIYDLALKMVRLSGLRPHEDIEIKVTGLRPGEKLYEELLTKKENTKPTHHPKIMIADKEGMDLEKMDFLFMHLSDVVNSGIAEEIVRTMKWMVPEYISRNSEFCDLDVTLVDA
jgi:FlaA1/EpsC-like NDP-sugar epimerase